MSTPNVSLRDARPGENKAAGRFLIESALRFSMPLRGAICRLSPSENPAVVTAGFETDDAVIPPVPKSTGGIGGSCRTRTYDQPVMSR